MPEYRGRSSLAARATADDDPSCAAMMEGASVASIPAYSPYTPCSPSAVGTVTATTPTPMVAITSSLPAPATTTTTISTSTRPVLRASSTAGSADLATPSNGGSSLDGGALTRGDHIRVAVRVRPLPNNEDGIIEVAGIGAIAVRKDAATGGNEFLKSQQGRIEERTFDRVFGPQSSQSDVFAWSCRPLIQAAIQQSRSATIFVYGATGAGKTYTMFGGPEPQQAGLIFRAIPVVFQELQERRRAVEASLEGEKEGTYEVKVSFLEIYNENVRDLLQEGGGAGQCRVLEDERRGLVKVANLVEAVVNTPEEALQYLHNGMQARTVEATAANSQSSRAHAVFSLCIEQVKEQVTSRGAFTKRTREVRQVLSKISLIDLAGSERAALTQNSGNALKDGARINQSLLALANCIDALCVKGGIATPRKKPPYRDSKLTLMLKSSLTGDGLVAMIANVHPGRTHFEDSNNTLEYARRASTVRNPTASGRRLSRTSTSGSASALSSSAGGAGGGAPSAAMMAAYGSIATATAGSAVVHAARLQQQVQGSSGGTGGSGSVFAGATDGGSGSFQNVKVYDSDEAVEEDGCCTATSSTSSAPKPRASYEEIRSQHQQRRLLDGSADRDRAELFASTSAAATAAVASATAAVAAGAASRRLRHRASAGVTATAAAVAAAATAATSLTEMESESPAMVVDDSDGYGVEAGGRETGGDFAMAMVAPRSDPSPTAVALGQHQHQHIATFPNLEEQESLSEISLASPDERRLQGQLVPDMMASGALDVDHQPQHEGEDEDEEEDSHFRLQQQLQLQQQRQDIHIADADDDDHEEQEQWEEVEVGPSVNSDIDIIDGAEEDGEEDVEAEVEAEAEAEVSVDDPLQELATPGRHQSLSSSEVAMGLPSTATTVTNASTSTAAVATRQQAAAGTLAGASGGYFEAHGSAAAKATKKASSKVYSSKEADRDDDDEAAVEDPEAPAQVQACADAAALAAASELIAELKAEKLQLTARLRTVTEERNTLLQQRRDMEEENERLREVGCLKDRRLAMLLRQRVAAAKAQ